MARKRNDYFQLIEEQLSHSVRASELLGEILTGVTPETIQSYKERMHEIEHQGDEIHHSILSSLSAEFITPIDQEDILHLVQLIDDITERWTRWFWSCICLTSNRFRTPHRCWAERWTNASKPCTPPARS